MFTGIITGVGRIAAVDDLGLFPSTASASPSRRPPGYLDDVGLGDSIALNGACMTVTSSTPARSRFTIDISAESLDKTAGLGDPGAGQPRKGLRAQDRLGGHIVSGHVDGIGRVPLRAGRRKLGAAHPGAAGAGQVPGLQGLDHRQRREPHRQQPCSRHAEGCELSINLIPHTVENTALHALKAGSRVNLEIDLIARYVERMLAGAGKVTA
jgi:riboflavin synthase